MTGKDGLQLAVLAILLACSAYFSSAETALTTVNKVRIRMLADEGDRRAQTLLKVLEDPARMLGAILVGNNIVNISASSLATTLVVGLRAMNRSISSRESSRARMPNPRIVIHSARTSS